MIVTTTQTLDGYKITDYHGLVCGECIIGTNIVGDLTTIFTDAMGTRSASYENALIEARDTAFNEMIENAESVDADAIVGIQFDYESLSNSMLMVTATGTDVYIKAKVTI